MPLVEPSAVNPELSLYGQEQHRPMKLSSVDEPNICPTCDWAGLKAFNKESLDVFRNRCLEPLFLQLL